MRIVAGMLPLIMLLGGCAVQTSSSTSHTVASSTPALDLASPLATMIPGGVPGQGSEPASPTPLPAPSSTHIGPYGVLVDLLSQPASYTISVGSKDANVVASRSAAKRSPVANAGGHGLDLPYISATSSALYYLDGDSTVRALTVDGWASGAQPVAQLDVGAGLEATFAVSPDTTKIAVSVLDFNRSPVHVRLYVDNLAGGARRVIYESDTNYVWPVAWHGGLLVLAHAYDPYLEDVAKAAPRRDNPYWAVSYHLVDPATAHRVILMGSCTPSGPLSPVGSACIQGGSIDWSGNTTVWSTNDWGAISAAASISPDGSFVAAARPDDQQYVAFWRPGGAIATWVAGPGAEDWAGWLDSTHVLIASAVSPDFQPRIVALT
ncbi:MAG: hypothetical protein ACYDAL_13730 [Candidatus Dormibacteraceae bacterium]